VQGIDYVGEWILLGACSSTCGPGLESRAFTIPKPAAHDRAALPVSPDTWACNAHLCTVDCQCSLGNWSACKYPTRTQTRQYVVTGQPQHGGRECEGSVSITPPLLECFASLSVGENGNDENTSTDRLLDWNPRLNRQVVVRNPISAHGATGAGRSLAASDCKRPGQNRDCFSPPPSMSLPSTALDFLTLFLFHSFRTP